MFEFDFFKTLTLKKSFCWTLMLQFDSSRNSFCRIWCFDFNLILLGVWWLFSNLSQTQLLEYDFCHTFILEFNFYQTLLLIFNSFQTKILEFNFCQTLMLYFYFCQVLMLFLIQLSLDSAVEFDFCQRLIIWCLSLMFVRFWLLNLILRRLWCVNWSFLEFIFCWRKLLKFNFVKLGCLHSIFVRL